MFVLSVNFHSSDGQYCLFSLTWSQNIWNNIQRESCFVLVIREALSVVLAEVLFIPISVTVRGNEDVINN